MIWLRASYRLGSDAQTWLEEVYMMMLAQDAAGGILSQEVTHDAIHPC